MKINKKQLINIIILGLFLLNLGHLIFLQEIRNIQAASLWDSQEGKTEIGSAWKREQERHKEIKSNGEVTDPAPEFR